MQICTRPTSMTQRNSWKRPVRIEGSDFLHLPVSLSKALKDAHSKGPSNLHVRAARFYRRLHLGKWSTHSKRMCRCAYTYSILFVYCNCTMYSTVSPPSEYALNTLYWKFVHRSGFLSNFTLALENRVCPEIFHCIEYMFYHTGFLSHLHLTWKQSLPWIFTELKHFLSFRIFEQLALALKTEFALKCFKPRRGLRPHDLVRLLLG